MTGNAKFIRLARPEAIGAAMPLRRRLPRHAFEAALLDLLLADLELLHLLAHRHGERIHETDELRNLEGCDLAAAEIADLLDRGLLALLELDPRQHGLAQLGVGQSDYVDVA